MLLSRIAVEQQAGEYPEDAEDAPGGMNQMVEGQVVVDGEEDAGTAVDVVREIPADFEELGDRIAERDDQAGDQPALSELR